MHRTTSEVVIIGAGGHGHEVLDTLLTREANRREIEPLGFIDENPDYHGHTLDSSHVPKDFHWFECVDRSEIGVVCAVGTSQVCRRLAQQAKALGLRLASAISPRACISPDTCIG